MSGYLDKCMRYWCYGVIVSMHLAIGSASNLVWQWVRQKVGQKTYNCLYAAERTGGLRLGQIGKWHCNVLTKLDLAADMRHDQ